MSKSKGNILDPIDLIDGIELAPLIEKRTRSLMQPEMSEKIEANTREEFPDGIPSFGTDALRFTYCALASTGRDIRFDINRLEGYRNFCNKLWNAARYVLMNMEKEDSDLGDGPIELSPADRWIQSQLQQLIATTHKHFTNYRFDLLTQALRDFIWHEYCDWYLELSKPILYSAESSASLKRGTLHTLVSVLEILLRLLHPIMPFITEEIWQQVGPLAGKAGATIMLQPYPSVKEKLIDDGIVAEIEWVKTVITGVRNIRGEMNISPNQPVPVFLHKGASLDQQRLENNRQFLSNLAKLESITWLNGDATPPIAATALAGEMEILIPLENLIDKEAELARLDKEITKLQKDQLKATTKLQNPNFLKNAPADVVEKEQNRLHEMQMAIEKLQEQVTRVSAIG